jgi:DNA-binding GntR family transcriptional regulator
MGSGAGELLHITGGRAAHESLIGLERTPRPGDVLSVDDIRAIYRLLKVMYCDLARRSAPLLRVADLDQLEQVLHRYGSSTTTIGQAEFLLREFIVGLIRADATNPELSTIVSLSKRLGRHFQARMRQLGLLPRDLPDRGEMHYQALQDFREGDPDLAEQAILRIINYMEVDITRDALRLRRAGIS